MVKIWQSYYFLEIQQNLDPRFQQITIRFVSCSVMSSGEIETWSSMNRVTFTDEKSCRCFENPLIQGSDFANEEFFCAGISSN